MDVSSCREVALVTRGLGKALRHRRQQKQSASEAHTASLTSVMPAEHGETPDHTVGHCGSPPEPLDAWRVEAPSSSHTPHSNTISSQALPPRIITAPPLTPPQPAPPTARTPTPRSGAAPPPCSRARRATSPRGSASGRTGRTAGTRSAGANAVERGRRERKKRSVLFKQLSCSRAAP